MSDTDQIISRLTVRIDSPQASRDRLGSGVIWKPEAEQRKLYVLTAAHCLFADGDTFKQPRESVVVQFYNHQSNSYHPISAYVNQHLLFRDPDKDVAVLVFDKDKVEELVGEIPGILYARERYGEETFVIKGFPQVTKGELDVLYPVWQQRLTGVHKFQLKPDKNYSQWQMQGYSGSGIFFVSDGQIYLTGIFTRFREETKGNVLYCQYLDTVNEILETNFLPSLPFSYVGKNGIHQEFFSRRLAIALDNLGPRFNAQLNFKLPLARKFNDLAKDSHFRSRAYRIFDNWLTERSYRTLPDNPHLGPIEERLGTFKSEVVTWFSSLDFSGQSTFDIGWIREEIAAIGMEIQQKTSSLYKLQRQQQDGDDSPIGERRELFENEIVRLREIERSNANFLRNIETKIDIALVNQPFLLITGDAGEGKSHILGDIAHERLKRGEPALLLLGQHFYSSKTIGANILEQLDLQCSFSEFLTVINDIGKQVNSRILFMIDALNESKGTEIWKDSLSGFITQVASYPNIALVLTIRSTYYENTIPENLQYSDDGKKDILTIVTHEGFAGKEYEALRLFCEYYGLKQPTFPILAPEFTNPLFLQLVCIGISNSGEKSFPNGFHGIKRVLDYYVSAINKKLSLKGEYANRPDLVRQAMQAIAMACYAKPNRLLTLEEAVTLFDNEFKNFPNLLQELIQENILIRNVRYYQSEGMVDTIYFAFERLGDFIIAEQLIKGYSGTDAVMQAFSAAGPHALLLEHYNDNGVVEALSVLLPEGWGLEIFEVFGWLLPTEQTENENKADKDDDGQGDDYDYAGEYVGRFTVHFLKSLRWRSADTVNIDKIRNADQNGLINIDIDSWLQTVTEFSAVPGHPLNSDLLHDLLSIQPLPVRDSFWQFYLHHYESFDNYYSNSSIKRLIDWSWTQGISVDIDTETARLAGQAMAWVLASTHINLRDQATKAMVNLLQAQHEALISILQAFEPVDDPYIQQRLFAVAYGCVLRGPSVSAGKGLMLYTYERIFKQGDPPKDIMLRDYARNICEYGNTYCADLEFDMVLVRPPYKSTLPTFPSKQDIDRYELPYLPDDEDRRQRQRICFNRIHHSVIKDDFGDKVVNNAVREFLAVPRNGENELKEFKARLDKEKKKAVNGIRTCVELMAIMKKYHQQHSRVTGETHEEAIERVLGIMGKEMEKLSQDERRWMNDVGIPYMKVREVGKLDKHLTLATAPIKYWIVQRAFELGWDIELHGKYDDEAGNYNNRHNNRVERIGKKYQWIAYYEILGIIADNFRMEARWGKTRGQFFKGTWQLFLRNIDPAYITPDIPDMDDEEDEQDNHLAELDEKLWWQAPDYMHWNIPAAQWAFQKEDLPNPEDVLLKKDEQGQQWLYLSHSLEWREPKALGAEKYGGAYKRLVYMIQGYLVRKTQREQILGQLQYSNFQGNWMPDNNRSYSRLINREKFWSPAYENDDKEPIWRELPNTRFKLIVADTKAKGAMEGDKSGANTQYHMPCRTLFEGMGLRYCDNDGDFSLPDGTLAVSSPEPEAPMVRRDLLERFLEERGLAIIWTLYGEKIADTGNHDYQFGVSCGVFSIKDNGVKGTITMHKMD